MCTVVTLKKGSLFFGRNMDIDFDFGQQAVILPRECPVVTGNAGTLLRHYALIGTARMEDGVPMYAEACNEKGLCMAGLNFPGNAVYAERAKEGKTSLATFELIPYVLGKCASVKEATELLQNAEITSDAFKPTLPVAPLHWIVVDETGSVTVERTQKGLAVYDNLLGVLTNNPPFPFHLKNVKKYAGLSASFDQNSGARVDKTDFSEGLGAVGLPGDFSSPSRFVKAWFLLENSICGESVKEKVSQTFHILSAVAMIRGAVKTESGREDVTAYSCCIDARRHAYYYKTYDSLAVRRIRLSEKYASGDKPVVFDFQ